MRIGIWIVLALLFLPVLVAAQTMPAASTSEAPKPIPGFDLSALDKTSDPCVDFYQYACGNWVKQNPIPPDKTRWGRFQALSEYNLYILRDILEKASGPGPHSAIEEKVGDYYAACMDEPTIEKKGITPLRPEMDRIAAIKSRKELIAQVAHLHSNAVQALFSF